MSYDIYKGFDIRMAVTSILEIKESIIQ